MAVCPAGLRRRRSNPPPQVVEGDAVVEGMRHDDAAVAQLQEPGVGVDVGLAVASDPGGVEEDDDAVAVDVVSQSSDIVTTTIDLIVAGADIGINLPNPTIWLQENMPFGLRGRAAGGLTSRSEIARASCTYRGGVGRPT